MKLNPLFFDDFWLMLAGFFYLLILIKAVRSAEWWRLKDHTDFNILINATIGVAIAWYLKVDFPDAKTPYLSGLNLHLVGATLMTMMFGWAYSIIAMLLVHLSDAIFSSASIFDALMVLPLNALVTSVLPATLSYAIFKLVDSKLPNNFFIYIFVCSFFSAALAMATVILTTTALHELSGAYTMEVLSYTYLPYGLILMFPEAFTTGMLMSIFVVYRPEWIKTFDDQRYLYNKK